MSQHRGQHSKISSLMAVKRPAPESSWSICTPRMFDLLEPASTVLIAGCGGGYDVMSGIPLYFALKEKGKKVLLASLSFTNLPAKISDKEYSDMCHKVSTKSKLKCPPDDCGYFPELYLSRWFMDRFKEDVPIFTFYREIGVSQLSKAYNKICKEHKVDAIVLADGGTDSVMFGYEQRMGTPVEDQSSILAVKTVENVPVKILTCIGFGVDSFHGVSHGLFLENVSTLERSGGYLGSFSVSPKSAEGRLYIEAYEAVKKCMQPSIVCSSITDAMQGHFGNHHSTERTGSSKLFINPLMSMYWTFELGAIVDQIPYAKELVKTKSANDVRKVIAQHQTKAHTEDKIREPIPLPM